MSGIYVNKGSYKDNFAMLPNQMLQDERLSWKARGLLSYMLSMPQDWVFYDTELVKHSEKDGISGLRSAMKELKEFGYVKKVRVIDQETKRVTHWETHVTGIPDDEIPDYRKPTIWKSENVENLTLQSTNNTNKNNTNNNNEKNEIDEVGNKLTKKENEFFEIYNNLDNLPKCSAYSEKRKKQLNSLIKKYGLEKITNYVTELNERPYILSSKQTKAKWLKFDFVLREETYVKCIDGGYMNYCEGYEGPREQKTQYQLPPIEYQQFSGLNLQDE